MRAPAITEAVLQLLLLLLIPTISGQTASRAPALSPVRISSNATSSNATSGNATSGNATSGNATSSNVTNSNATSSNATTTPVLTRPPSVAPSVANSPAPSMGPTITAVLTTDAPSGAPSILVSPPPTSLPTTPAVTTAPAMKPTRAVTKTTNLPSATPTASPTASPAVIPTKAPKPATAKISPTRTPSAAPSNKATSSPTTAGMKVDLTVKGVQITFQGVGRLSDDDIKNLQTEMTDWFDAYFNTNATRRDRQLQRVADVRNMNSAYDVTNQDTTTTPRSNIVTYSQTLNYQASPTASDPMTYVLLPFADTPYNRKLASSLSMDIPAFGSLSSPIATPSVTDTSSKSGGDSGGLSLGAIIGIAVGGAVGLACLAYGAFALGNRDRSSGEGYRPGQDEEHDLNDRMPSQFLMSNDDDVISTMDDPTVAKIGSADNSALGGYGDQSVATVDYDYSKAYGGGGDNSVVSSVGGTLGDATRQTAGEVAAGSAAARAALGASYEDHQFRGDARMASREEVIVIEAPAGKLGVVIDTPDDGAPVVHAVKDSSVIANQIQVGDKLIKVDDEDVRSMTAIKVSKLISKKSANPVRRLTIVRTSHSENP